METHGQMYRRDIWNNFTDFHFGFMVSFALIDYTVGVGQRISSFDKDLRNQPQFFSYQITEFSFIELSEDIFAKIESCNRM